MFVTDFKKIALKSKKFKTSEYLYKWNPNTEKLEKTLINWQDEINKYKGMDLKSMLNKGIVPNSNNNLFYGDATTYKDINIHNLHSASNIDLSEFLNIDDSNTTKPDEMTNMSSDDKKEVLNNDDKKSV